MSAVGLSSCLQHVGCFTLQFESKPRGKHARKIAASEKSDAEKLAVSRSEIAELKKVIVARDNEIQKLKCALAELRNNCNKLQEQATKLSIDITLQRDYVNLCHQGKYSCVGTFGELSFVRCASFLVFTCRESSVATRHASGEPPLRPRPIQNDTSTVSCTCRGASEARLELRQN